MKHLVNIRFCSTILCLSSILVARPQNVTPDVPGASVPRSPETVLAGFDDYMIQLMKEWKVPGVGIAIVCNGRIILSKGYGLRSVAKNLAVTSNTLFGIASVTKSFTVTTLGIEADEGRVEWDKPVRQYLPGFRMYDPVATERITVRDLLTHRSGIPRHPLVGWTSDIQRKDVVHRLQYLEPSADVRTRFQYSNLMYVVAGYVAEQVTGMTWEDLVRQRVLGPLGMTATNFSLADLQKSRDFSMPYAEFGDTVREVPFHNLDNIGPAGEINSTAADMARYLLFHINCGLVAGKRILSEANAQQMQSPQVAITGPPDQQELGPSAYGMGFFTTTYRGYRLVEHPGDAPGYATALAFLPDQKSGVVVMANLSSTFLRDIVAYNVLDRLLGLEQLPWSQRFREFSQKRQASQRAAADAGYTYQTAHTHPSHELSSYVGEFNNAGYGTIMIAPREGKLQIVMNGRARPLEHFHYDIFEIPADPLDPLRKRKVAFSTDLRGDIRSLSISLDPHVNDIVFDRVPDKRMREKSFLEPFAGEYDTAGQNLTIAFQGDDTLMVIFGGHIADREPPRELIPVRETLFELRGLRGASIEFKRLPSGKTQAIVRRGINIMLLDRK